ncbi:glucokinase [Shigella flexneri]
MAVYGAGTGLGVAHLVHVDKRWVSFPGEGGHVDFAPIVKKRPLSSKYCVRKLVMFGGTRASGPGLVNCIAQLLKPTTACQKISSQKIYRTRAG